MDCEGSSSQGAVGCPPASPQGQDFSGSNAVPFGMPSHPLHAARASHAAVKLEGGADASEWHNGLHHADVVFAASPPPSLSCGANCERGLRGYEWTIGVAVTALIVLSFIALMINYKVRKNEPLPPPPRRRSAPDASAPSPRRPPSARSGHARESVGAPPAAGSVPT